MRLFGFIRQLLNCNTILYFPDLPIYPPRNRTPRTNLEGGYSATYIHLYIYEILAYPCTHLTAQNCFALT